MFGDGLLNTGCKHFTLTKVSVVPKRGLTSNEETAPVVSGTVSKNNRTKLQPE